MAGSFTLNSIDYSGTDYKLHVLSHTIDYNFRVNVSELAQANNFVAQGQTFGPIIFTLDCAVVANSTTARDTCFGNVIAALVAAHIAGLTDFDADFIGSSGSQARPLDGPKDIKYTLNSVNFKLSLVVPFAPPEEEEE
jgi:hypothetical protein